MVSLPWANDRFALGKFIFAQGKFCPDRVVLSEYALRVTKNRSPSGIGERLPARWRYRSLDENAAGSSSDRRNVRPSP